MPASREDLAWAAGLFEGEGCITWRQNTARNGQVYPALQVKMTDEDRVRRFREVVGVGLVRPHVRPMKSHHKQQWAWKVYSYESCQAVIALLWVWLGPRRRARAVEVLRTAQNTRTRNGYRPKRLVAA